MQSINPYNNEVIASYTEATQDQIKEILKKSANAFLDWKQSTFIKRSEYLLKTAELLKSESYRLAKNITLEMGKPIKESIAEVLKCAWVCEYYAHHAQEFLADETIETEASSSKVVYEPIGTILGIMPWNFPFWQVFRFLAPTLMSGNTALLKHASNVQGCAGEIENLLQRAGYQEGIFQNLRIKSNKVESIVKNPIVKAVTLTGSEFAGSEVASIAGKEIKKTVLELGGNNAFIVLEDADINKAVDEALTARMMNCGQSCIASKRFILLPSIANEFIAKYVEKTTALLTGDPINETTQIGPLSSVAQAKEVDKQVTGSIQLGAKLLCGGKRNNAIYSPTVLEGVIPGMPCFDDEIFGPVASMIYARNENEAVKLCNLSRFGLGATIYTSNYEHAKKLIPKIEDGAVFVNSLVKSDPRLPFGGTKRSGYGRELSIHGIREFVNAKTVYFA
jgi:succinate-semialdehyde dehydrogenase/glutarate-semialdehyde dehydrogenase